MVKIIDSMTTYELICLEHDETTLETREVQERTWRFIKTETRSIVAPVVSI